MIEQLFDPNAIPATPVGGRRTLAPGWTWYDAEAECNLLPYAGPPYDLDGIAEVATNALRAHGFLHVVVEWDMTSTNVEWMPYTARASAPGRSEEEVQHELHATLHQVLQDNDRWQECQGLEIDEETT